MTVDYCECDRPPLMFTCPDCGKPAPCVRNDLASLGNLTIYQSRDEVLALPIKARVEAAAVKFDSNIEAARFIRMDKTSFERLCLMYGIETPIYHYLDRWRKSRVI